MTDTLSRGKENRACYRQLRTLLYINSEQTSMELALKELNNYIREHYKSLFVDLLYFELDSRNRLIRFINAGFEPIACYSASRQVLQVFSDTDSVPLGITENVSYRQKEVQLFEDDTLVFFNSGVTRARNNAGVLFGIEGIKRVLHAVYKANPGEIAHHTVYEALTFNRARSRSDMIVLAVKVS
jgi:sigma-B regulation protein RsbU (phosphoserine phosphatase)